MPCHQAHNLDVHSVHIQRLPAPINWDGYQVADKQYEPNGQWCKHLQTHWVIVNRDKMHADGETAKYRFNTLILSLNNSFYMLIRTCRHLVVT